MIILTAEQADHVRGPTSNGAALMPVPTEDGGFILSENVLEDPNHEMHHEYLSTLPTGEYVPLTEVIE